RSVAEREQTSRRLLHEHRTALLLDELDEAVGGVQPELHGQKLREHTFDVHFGHGFRVSRRIPRSPESGLFKEMRTRIIRPGFANRTNGNAKKTSVRIDRSAGGRGGSTFAAAVQGRSFLVTKRSRLTRFVGVLALLAALAFLAGCGGGGNKSSSGGSSS